MEKKIRDLTTAEEEAICARQRESAPDSAKRACKNCPLRWANHCTLCVDMMPRSLFARMMNVIGNNVVEV